MSSLKIVQSKHGKPAIIYQRYFYTELKSLMSSDIIWMCPKKNCYASIRTNQNRCTVLEVRGEHKHTQLTDSEIEKYEVSIIVVIYNYNDYKTY